MRIPQPIGTKGSLKWIQTIINICPSILDQQILTQLKLNLNKIDWISPLKSDNYAEYRDDDFLIKLGLNRHIKKLYEFWPKGGPQWDSFGKNNEENYYFLVEAKANIAEIISNLKAKSVKSISKIRKSLNKTQIVLNCRSNSLWETAFYQYANRLAFLYFLRNFCNVNAYLIFLYFINDYTHIPTTQQEWNGAIDLQKRLMGLKRHKLQRYVTDVFLDVNKICG